MGLIRSGQTHLTPMDDEALVDYLWPIAREMVKTAVENDQNLILEGCYIPFDWKESFEEEYRCQIRCVWLIMSEEYIRSHFADIRNHANAIEQRRDDSGLSVGDLIRDNARNLDQCKKHGCEYILIDGEYNVKL